MNLMSLCQVAAFSTTKLVIAIALLDISCFKQIFYRKKAKIKNMKKKKQKEKCFKEKQSYLKYKNF